jgi:hypothetical protein
VGRTWLRKLDLFAGVGRLEKDLSQLLDDLQRGVIGVDGEMAPFSDDLRSDLWSGSEGRTQGFRAGKGKMV